MGQGAGNRGDANQHRPRIYIANIPYDMRWQEVKDLFKEKSTYIHIICSNYLKFCNDTLLVYFHVNHLSPIYIVYIIALCMCILNNNQKHDVNDYFSK